MTTPINGYPKYGDYLVSNGTGGTLYQEPKAANLLDVEDYTTHANEYVVVNSTGTGWTYTNTVAPANATQFSNLNDVSWNAGNWGIGKYLIVGNGVGGVNVDYTSVPPIQLQNFSSLNDTFQIGVGNTKLSLLQVNATQQQIQPTNFGIDAMLFANNTGQNTLCYWYSEGGKNFYAFRAKTLFQMALDTPQGIAYQGTLNGYDATVVAYTQNSAVSGIGGYFHPLVLQTYNIGGGSAWDWGEFPIVTDTSVWDYNGNFVNPNIPIPAGTPLPGLIRLQPVAEQNLAGVLKPVFEGAVSFSVQISAYLSLHNDPVASACVSIGIQVIDKDQFTVVETFFDSVVIQGAKPAASGKIASMYIVKLETGQSILPVFRVVPLGLVLSPPQEIDIVSFQIDIQEL